jgi:putative transposase
VFHVFARGVERSSIFRDRVDYETYLAILLEVVRRFDWRCLSYCLMPNHAHLLIDVPANALGPGMQRLHGDYGRQFNRRHARRGHVFESRYGSVRIRNDVHLMVAARYLALNPVRAGLAPSAGEWRWSSWTTTPGGNGLVDPARLLHAFGADGGDPLARFADFVSQAA